MLFLVNVASKCGFTPQYQGLEALHQKYKAKGFEVLGFPCNDFGAQEPGTTQEIKTFCASQYQVTFPLFDKLHVKGQEQHPLYAALTGKRSPLPGEVKWNFGKFLIGRDGKLIQRFESKVAPDSPEVVQAIEAALAQKVAVRSCRPGPGGGPVIRNPGRVRQSKSLCQKSNTLSFSSSRRAPPKSRSRTFSTISWISPKISPASRTTSLAQTPVPRGSSQGYTHALIMTFTDAAARDAYLPHPENERVKAVQ